MNISKGVRNLLKKARLTDLQAFNISMKRKPFNPTEYGLRADFALTSFTDLKG